MNNTALELEEHYRRAHEKGEIQAQTSGNAGVEVEPVVPLNRRLDVSI